MINHHIHAALAQERASSFLAEAQAGRQARLAGTGRRGGPARPQPVADGTPTALRDGSEVLIRPVRASDAPLLADGFARLSARSRLQRFLSPKHALSAAELRFLTDIDHY